MTTLESSQKLADLIARIAAGVTVVVEKAGSSVFNITVTHDGQTVQFQFDQGGKEPDASDAISALWARATLIGRGESEFYHAFYHKAFQEHLEKGEPLKKDYTAHFAEWKRSAEDTWQVFGDWFGRRLE